MMDSYAEHLRHGINYMRRNTEVIQPEGHATDLFSAWAVNYLRQRATHREQPFFLYLAYNAPHAPIEPPAAWLENVKRRTPHLDEKRARNVALVEHLDDRIGSVLDALAASGLAEDTVVVFTSDNGGSLAHAQNNDPWRGGKESHYDGGLRVPFMIRWPGRVHPGARCDYAGLTFDLFPTFIELAGEMPAGNIDAVSLVPLLEDSTILEPRDLYFVRREGGPTYGGKSYEAIIRGRWKLLQNDPYRPLELYDLTDDPQEKKNVAARNKQVVDELAERLRGHIQRGGATPWQKKLAD
jgi:arylsulfatase A-like enzyme